jgi:curved DNA-binding protein CbpA
VRERTRLQIRALDEMGLPHAAEPKAIRERYGVLVKQYHPDSNGGDRSMEHRLAIVIRAFKALKASGLA